MHTKLMKSTSGHPRCPMRCPCVSLNHQTGHPGSQNNTSRSSKSHEGALKTGLNQSIAQAHDSTCNSRNRPVSSCMVSIACGRGKALRSAAPRSLPSHIRRRVGFPRHGLRPAVKLPAHLSGNQSLSRVKLHFKVQ